MWKPCRLGWGRRVSSVRMRGHEWEALGVHTRRYVRAGDRACAFELAKMIGFSMLAQSEHFPGLQRRLNEIYGDFSAVFRDGGLVGVREQFARELAAFLLEECAYSRDESAIVGVATELVFPRAEAERAWQHFNGDLEKLGDYYADHVPSAWFTTTMQCVMNSQVVTLIVSR